MPRPELKDVIELLCDPLRELGYHKRRLGSFTHEFNADILGVIEIRVFKKPDGLQTEPFIGVRHQPVERLYRKLEGENFHPYDPKTISTNLSLTLVGKRRYMSSPGGWWTFSDEADLKRRGPAMVEALRQHGLPFIEKLASLEAIVEQLVRTDVSGYYAVLAMHLLSGPAAALEQAHFYLSRCDGRVDPAAMEYRRFIARFLEHIRQQGQEISPTSLRAVQTFLESD